MTRALAMQLDLFTEKTSPKAPAKPRDLNPAGRDSRTVNDGYEPFDFQPGPECEPRPGWVIPEELRLPTDPERPAK